VTSLDKNDYQDPICPFDFSQYEKGPRIESIPIDRVTAKVDEFLSRNDYLGAERTLHYWLSEARNGHDGRGEFMIHNELMGLYRKLQRKEEAIQEAEIALQMAPILGFEDTVTGATGFLNAATVYKAFEQADKALPLYQKAKEVYERELNKEDSRLGGLYNNMALAYMDLGQFEEALNWYNQALEMNRYVPLGELDSAITYLNLADLITVRDGIEESGLLIEAYLKKAENCIKEANVPHDGYYAYVCEKCATIFGFYGMKELEEELLKVSKEIYERP